MTRCGGPPTSTSRSTARLAVTAGDPRGIGPEIRDAAVMECGREFDLVLVGSTRATRRLSALEAGTIAAADIREAVRLALAGEVDGIVTGPVEKKALHEAGCPYPGVTEFVADLTGTRDVAMMLASDRLRVVLATTHIPLRSLFEHLTVERVVRTGRITREWLARWWGIESPRLVLCGVNPHLGEGGAFGSEDQTILEPAARELGCAGPLPADTVFVRALRGEYDAVIAPYHDVGMTAIKVASFGQAVNVTLGLPFPRTSPDHGTAFDIAGTGAADPSSMIQAVRLAARLAVR